MELFEPVDIVFIYVFGIRDMKIDVKIDNEWKMWNFVFKDQLVAFKKLMNPDLTLIEKFQQCSGKEFFKILNLFHVVKFY